MNDIKTWRTFKATKSQTILSIINNTKTASINRKESEVIAEIRRRISFPQRLLLYTIVVDFV